MTRRCPGPACSAIPTGRHRPAAERRRGGWRGAAEWPSAAVLAGRGIAPVSYAEWLRIETAEAQLAQDLGRGERVKLHNRAAIWSACRPEDL